VSSIGRRQLGTRGEGISQLRAAAAPPASLELCVSRNQKARFGYRNAATNEL